jgi:recombination protein RecR
VALGLPSKLQNALDQLGRIPGIGAKTALRQALQISNWDKRQIEEFAVAIRSLGELVHCENCGMFCDEITCNVCSSHKRAESKVICVVESVTDCLAIEKSEKYFGLYHVLGGVLNPLLGIGPDELNFSKLTKRVQDEEIQSLILAINPSVEGDATCAYIRQELPKSISIERIGFGIPIGGSLEYVDSMTISKALENRKTM